MASNKSFLDNLSSGALNPKGNLADYQHAARLYVDSQFALTPKSKFLYHVTFNINPNATAVIPQLTEKHQNELNMLVKNVDLPGFKIETDVKHQYNKKAVVQKRIDYDPVNITFHDDNFGVTTALWEAYYRYYYRDGNYATTDNAGSPGIVTPQYKQASRLSSTESPFSGNVSRYGFDNDSFEPFFSNIVIYQMSRKRYTAMTLVNPIISSWQHDTMDQTVSDFVESRMTLDYEAVFYTRGPVTQGSAPKGFGTEHYDTTPSPISLAGGGGVGGLLNVLGGGADVLQDVSDIITGDFRGNLLGTVLKAANVVNNAGGLTSEGLRQEGFNILKNAIGKQAGVDVSGVANSFFPKNGGNGGLNSIIAGAAVVGGLALGNKSTGELAKELAANPSKADDLAKSTSFLKQHLANGGSSDPQSVSDAYDAQSNEQKQAQRDAVINDLPNLTRA